MEGFPFTEDRIALMTPAERDKAQMEVLALYLRRRRPLMIQKPCHRCGEIGHYAKTCKKG